MNLPISPVAKRLEDAAKRADKSLKDLSLAAGRNHAYLQQFVKRGTPRVLPEDVRVTLAVELDADPDDFLDHSVKPTAPRIPGVTTASKLGRQKAGPRSGASQRRAGFSCRRWRAHRLLSDDPEHVAHPDWRSD